jgi:D-alanyl-D-alanine carboxypeptidase
VRLISQVVLVALVLAGCAGSARTGDKPALPATSPPPAGPLSSGAAAELDALVDAWVAEGNGTGVTAAVVTADGTWSGAAGTDGAGHELVPESAMAIASITKTFTAAAVLSLAGDGLVDLDAPVEDYVVLPFDPRGATVRDALGMRASFPSDNFEAIVTEIEADLDRAWSAEDVLERSGPGRLGQRRGSPHDNNLNYVVLGELIEEVTGQSFAEVLRERLIEPAGLPRVWVQDDEVPEPPLTVAEASQRYAVVDVDGPYLPSRAMASAWAAADGMAADAPSLARWGYLLYGGHVLASGVVDEMTTGPDGYGLGTMVGSGPAEGVVGHGGDIASYHGLMFVWPADAVAVSVLVPNPEYAYVGTGTGAFGLASQLREALR